MNTNLRLLASSLLLLFILDLFLPIYCLGRNLHYSTFQNELKLSLNYSHSFDKFKSGKEINFKKSGISKQHDQHCIDLLQFESAVLGGLSPVEDLQPDDLIFQSPPNDFENDATGPSSPEFSGFESVTTDKMVDPFTGDFTYNLPLLEVPGSHDGGYPVTLAYHSGASPEQDASWVGHGFTLSPGAVNRNKRGFPDDINGQEATYINKVPPNISMSVTPNTGVEAYSFNVSANVSYTYNNYKGIRKQKGFSIGYLNAFGLNFSYDNGNYQFSPYVSITGLLNVIASKQKIAEQKNENVFVAKFKEKKWSKPEFNYPKFDATASNAAFGTLNANLGELLNRVGNDVTSPSIVSQYSGESVSGTINTAVDPPVIVGFNGGISFNQTTVFNKLKETKKVYGYLYLNEAYESNNSPIDNRMMDYHLEKDGEANARDQYLPVVVSDQDQYSVSAEGLSGNFRPYWKKGGLFVPSKVVSNMVHLVSGAQFHAGADIGGGGNIGTGNSVSKMLPDFEPVQGSLNNGNTDDLKFSKENKDEPVFFRFLGDLCGDVLVDNPSNVVEPMVNSSFEGQKGNVNAEVNSDFEGSGRIGRTSTITYYSNEQIWNRLSIENSNSNVPKLFYDYEYLNTNNYIDRGEVKIKENIGEFVITNPSGSTYVFALPVYNRNERNMNYNIPYQTRKNEIAGASKNDNLVYAKIGELDPCTGEENLYPYPESFLLTSIRSNNYRDINNDGKIDPGDLGGYTKFGYRKVYGSVSKSDVSTNWFNWRLPYTGLYLNHGKLWDRTDDMGSFSSGEKEICYLEKIETKTHIAYFITNKTDVSTSVHPKAKGSLVERQDALSAPIDNLEAAAKYQPGETYKKSEFLEKIMLFSKSVNSSNQTELKLIKTILFSYNYDAWPGVFGTTNAQNGKLTLHRVWSEDEEVINARVSPYEFKYKYPSDATTSYPNKYQDIANFYSPFLNSQSPNYLTSFGYATDRWGNYQKGGRERRAALMPYVNQTPDSDFDPAAWQLKQIKLPSGGEIHLQYEQDDYGYVQNRIATSMIHVEDDLNTDKINDYRIDLSKIGITTNNDALAYLKYFKDWIIKNNEFIYFKFLYNLTENSYQAFPLDATDCNQEYLDGYVKIKPSNCTVNGNFLHIKLADGNQALSNYINTLSLNNLDGLPRYMCYDFYLRETGKLAGKCDELDIRQRLGDADPATFARKVFEFCRTEGMPGLLGTDVCKVINPYFSFFRIPIMPTTLLPGKKGGGLRVKRILMLDKGMEVGSSDRALYGSEFNYVLDDEISSSGVATNEPQDGRDENPLIEYLKKREDKTNYKRLVSGIDKEQFEGPYGESFLPSPSVGYSRVVTRTIHYGLSDNGFSVNNFYTAKDYPYDGYITLNGEKRPLFYHTAIKKINPIPLSLPLGLINIKYSKLYMSQMYDFISFSRHGLHKSEEMFQGTLSNHLRTNNLPIYKKEYAYFEPGEEIPVVSDITQNPSLYAKVVLGREMEVYTERRFLLDDSKEGNLSLDAAVSITTPSIIPSFGANLALNHTKKEFGRLSTTHVTYLTNILKSTTEFKDGITKIIENVAFSKYTGEPVIVKTKDDYHNLSLSNTPTASREIFNYTQPLNLINASFKSKFLNESKELSISGNYSFQSSGNSYFEFPFPSIQNLNLAIGDLISLNNSSDHYYYVIGLIQFLQGTNIMMRYYLEDFNQAGALNSNYAFSKIIVYKSGRNQQISTAVGSISTFNVMNKVVNSPAPTTITDRNIFLASLNSNTSLLFGSSSTANQFSLINSNYNKQVTGGTSSCLAFQSCTYGCGVTTGSCISAGACLNLGINFTQPYNASNAELILYISDPQHNIDMPNYIANCSNSGFTINPMPNALNGILTSIQNTCCTNSANCSSCPPPAPSLPFYINSNTFSFTNLGPTATPVNSLVTVNQISSNLWGVYFNPTSTTSILIEFLISSDQIYLHGIANAIKQQIITYLNNIQPYNTTALANQMNGDRCLSETTPHLFYYFIGPKLITGQLFQNKDCYNYIPPTPCNNITVNTNHNAYLRTFKDPVSGDMYLAVLDKYHSTTNTAPYNSTTLPPYLQSLVNIEFSLNKLPCSNIQPPGNNPPQPNPFPKPYLLNYQLLGKANGIFTLHDYNKYDVLYYPPNEEPVLVNLLRFCNTQKVDVQITNTLSNSATVFQHNWSKIALPANYQNVISPGFNSILKNRKGFWNPQKSYVYKDSRVSSNATISSKVYNTGTYTLEFAGWENPQVNDKWILASTIKNYSPHGEPLEEEDALGIVSTSYYNKDNTLPSVVVKNAPSETVCFENFENPSSSMLGSIKSTFDAHSGNKCFEVSSNYTTIMNYNRIFQFEPFYIKFWAALDFNNNVVNTSSISKIRVNVEKVVNSQSIIYALDAQRIATCGKWSLFVAEVVLPNNFLIPNNTFKINITNGVYVDGSSSPTFTAPIYIDDVIINPKMAVCNAYVFDYTKRKLLTQFDDQHFGLFYHYNLEGKLVRKSKETERGIKMLEERQYNNKVKINRNSQ